MRWEKYTKMVILNKIIKIEMINIIIKKKRKLISIFKIIWININSKTFKIKNHFKAHKNKNIINLLLNNLIKKDVLNTVCLS